MEKVVIEMCIYILDNIYNEITIDELEVIFCYNKFYLVRAFKECTGYTIKEFINNVKILKTIDPLLFTNDTILKIALNNGFNSQEYYSEKFKNVIGIPPLQFRKEYQIDTSKSSDKLIRKKEYLFTLKQWEHTLLNMPYNISTNNKTKKLQKAA